MDGGSRPAGRMVVVAAVLVAAAAIAALALGISCWCTSPWPFPCVLFRDVGVDRIEVTQATQDGANAVRLVDRRPAAVRVFVALSGFGFRPDATGTLHVLSGGVDLTPAGIAPINDAAYKPKPSPDRNAENDTLNFEVLYPDDIPLPASGELTFRVALTRVPGGGDAANDTGEVTVPVVTRWRPNIKYVRLGLGTLSGSGCSLLDPPAEPTVESGRGDLMLRGMFPVSDTDADLYEQYSGASNHYCFPAPDGDALIESGLVSEYDMLLWTLELLRQGIAPDSDTYLYAWLLDNPLDPPDAYGYADQCGRVAFGNTLAPYFQRTFAHEIGHNVGLSHASGGPLAETGWDVGDRMEGEPVANGILGRVKSLGLPPAAEYMNVMQGSLLSTRTWVNPDTWDCLLDGGCDDCSASGDVTSTITSAFNAVLVGGAFDRGGGQVAWIGPLYRYPWPKRPSPQSLEAEYALVLTLDDGSTVRHAVDPRTADGPGELDGGLGMFSAVIAVDPLRSVVALEVEELATGTNLPIADRPVWSPSPPTVTIVQPAASSRITDTVVVRWQAADEDSESSPEALRYQLLYSPDDGASYRAVAVDVRGDADGASALFDPRGFLASPQGAGVLLVLASDGFHTAVAQVEGLAVVPGP